MADLPVFVERDPAVIMAESKAQLEQILKRELQPAQVEQLMLQFIVYRETLILERFNAGMRQMLYQFSTAPVLDYVAALVAVERLPAAAAGCTVRFTLVPGHAGIIIPAGTRVATGDGQTFETDDDYLAFPPSVNYIDVRVVATVPGKTGNNYAPGAVNKILDPLAFVATVENIDTTAGGSDVETDEQLRARIKLAPSQFSTAGSRGSYEFHAKSANASITDISISSPVPGTVLIVPLTEFDDVPIEIINDIYAVCSAERVRPLTDTVIVSGPSRIDYAIKLNVVLFENMDTQTSKNEITAALEKYTARIRKKLGSDVVRSEISKVAKLECVYDIEILSPSTLKVNEETYARCVEIVVNITGFDRG